MPTTAAPRWTYVGLLIALFGIPAMTTLHRMLAPDPTATGGIVAREIAILAITGLLLWVVTRGERLPLSSIGFRTDHVGRSLAWSLAIAALCLAAAVGMLAIYGAMGIHYGEGQSISRALPVTTLAVVRAGISEEVLYRGYAIERLQSLTGSKWIAVAISLPLFAAFHFRQGLAGVVLAFVLGGILTAFYLWKRDLLANMAGHFLVDFIPNVLLVGLGLVK
jgi:membrane protease YdiL (CAAX protease family)